MLSLKARLFLFVCRNRHLLSFKLKRRALFTWDTPIEDFRKEVSRASKLFGTLPDDIIVVPEQISDLYAEWIEPIKYQRNKTILYFHGGGYVSGTCKAHRMHVAKVVKGSGVGALLFEYRLAPENKFPAALEDSISAYKFLLEKGIAPSRIVFMGDSAGGGLCLATLNKIKELGLPQPAAAIALSPWTDLTNSGETFTTNLHLELLAPAESWTVFSHYYAGESDRTDLGMSPLYGDLKGLPPISIYVGSHETLLSDSTRYAEKAKEAGVDIKLTIGEELFHCYPICAPIFPEATEAMNEICEFIDENINK